MAKIYSQLEKAQLENTTSDASGAPKGQITYRTDTNVAKVSNGTVYKEIIDEDSTQILENKQLDFLEVASISNPDASHRRLALKTDGKLYLRTSSGVETAIGSGGGLGINYIANPDAESGTTGWATYADAAAAIPVNGTGGTAGITFTATSSSPLRTTSSFLLTKGGSTNLQGNGFSYDFTLDSADKSAPMSINFDYEIASGTYADNDIAFFIYDVTAGVLIYPTANSLKRIVGPGKTQTMEFQTSPTSTSYRLIGHIASTSTQNYTIKFDTFQVGPSTTASTQAFTALRYKTAVAGSYGNTTTTILDYGTKDFLYGDLVVTTGASWKATASSPGVYEVYAAILTDTNTNVGDVELLLYKNNAAFASLSLDDSDSADISKRYGVRGSAKVPMIAGDYIDIRLTNRSGATRSLITSDLANYIEIKKLPTALQFGAAGRVVAARFRYSSLVSTTANQPIAFDTVDTDTAGAVGPTPGRFTAPYPGTYIITGTGRTGAGATTGNFMLYKNGSLDSYLVNAAAQIIQPLSGQITVNAGDIIDLRFDQTAVIALEARFEIHLLSGPSQVAATETIAARYTSTAGQSISNSGSVLVTFPTKDIDTHNAFSSGVFTAPTSGLYRLSCNIRFQSAAYVAGNIIALDVFKNGSVYSGVYSNSVDASASFVKGCAGSALVRLAAGETADFRVFNNRTAGSTSIDTSASNCVFSVEKVGNY